MFLKSKKLQIRYWWEEQQVWQAVENPLNWPTHIGVEVDGIDELHVLVFKCALFECIAQIFKALTKALSPMRRNKHERLLQ